MDLNKSILISACDNGVYYDIKKYQKLVDDQNIDIIVWSFRNNPTSRNNPNMYAWMEVDEDDYVKSVSCKKFDENLHDLKTSHVIIGTMFFRKAEYFINGLNENYKNNIRTNNEFYVDDVINQNIKMGLNVKVFEVDNYICWGTPDDYETYNYWQTFFNKCNWHNYEIVKDITYHNFN
jgi:bifunctional N-acetylglucosamine-1-phosphate-uridyltransferase/glucosamine-1-phosphate-acetyltransferase GlmU-like protein